LLHNCSHEQRVKVLSSISFFEVVQNKKGTHAIQKMIDLMTLEQEKSLLMSLIKFNVA